MAITEKINQGTLESLCRVLGHTYDGFTGSELETFLAEANIQDINPESTKWKRLKAALSLKQNQDNSANNIFRFIIICMSPVRHIHNPIRFKALRMELNKILNFEGYFLSENGEIIKRKKIQALSESLERERSLREQLTNRQAHEDIFHYCRAELLVDNYFHTVFEATKSIADKIRLKTGLTTDGAILVQTAFSYKPDRPDELPHLAINSLQTESEQSEQKGFQNLLIGLFGTFRNTTAHAPKIKWEIKELDALDTLSLISLIHRRLDKATPVKKLYGNQE